MLGMYKLMFSNLQYISTDMTLYLPLYFQHVSGSAINIFSDINMRLTRHN